MQRSCWRRKGRGAVSARCLSLSVSSSGTASGDYTSSFSIKGDALEGTPSYLDAQATTPIDPRVLDAMMPYMLERYGNAHSKTHAFGWESEAAVEKARAQVAKLIGADPKEIIFTSGATESNNIALKGVSHFYSGSKKHIVTLVTEHKCVLDSARQLKTEGFEVDYLPVKEDGIVDLELLESTLRDDTAIVSVMGVNNEIGVVQPLKEIGAMCKARNIFFHSDIAQMAGKMDVDVKDMGINLASMSSHKVYGPKGVGAIYLSRRPRVRIDAPMSGGGQERGIRSGTLPTALIVGFGEACEVALNEKQNDEEWVEFLSKRLYDGITSQLDHVILNGSKTERYAGNLNLSFAYVEGESLLMALKNIAVSSGSACTSASLEPSYVLRALGVGDELAHSSIRFGISRFSTVEEIDFTISNTVRHVNRLREMSPLWEMVQDGIDLSTIQWEQEH